MINLTVLLFHNGQNMVVMNDEKVIVQQMSQTSMEKELKALNLQVWNMESVVQKSKKEIWNNSSYIFQVWKTYLPFWVYISI